MTVTLADLLTPRNRDVIEAYLLSSLQGQGFPVDDWNDGSVPRTLIKMFATGLLDREDLVKFIAGGGFLDIAASFTDANGNPVEGWCELLAQQAFSIDRAPATFSRKRFTLTCAAGAGPYTRAAGELKAVSDAGNYYTNVDAITIPDGGSTEVVFQAESPGSLKDPTGTVSLVTPLPGVVLVDALANFSTPSLVWTGTGTITPSAATMPSPARMLQVTITKSGRIGDAEFTLMVRTSGAAVTTGPHIIDGSFVQGDVTLAFIDGSSGTTSFIAGDKWTVATPGQSTIVIGSDVESLLSLVQRCRDRWPALSAIPTEGKFAGWARQCSKDNALGITRVSTVPSTEIAGTTNVYVAGYDGTASSEVLAILQAYVDARTPDIEKGLVFGASSVTINLTGGVQVKRGRLAAAKAAAKVAWNAYLASVPIGGDMPGHKVRITKLTEILMDSGAYTYGGLQLNGAAADLELLSNQVPAATEEGTDALEWTEVV